MEIIINNNLKIQVNDDDDELVSWSYDKFTDIVTLNFKDGSTWKFEKEFSRFYKLD